MEEDNILILFCFRHNASLAQGSGRKFAVLTMFAFDKCPVEKELEPRVQFLEAPALHWQSSKTSSSHRGWSFRALNLQ
jgi:hypothetical protein